MAHYLLQLAYTPESWAAQTKAPTNRIEAVSPVLQKLGGRLIGLYFCFGEYDVVVLSEMPDDNAALATSLASVTPGHLKAIKTTKLFTVEETMEAMRKAGRMAFQGPSRG